MGLQKYRADRQGQTQSDGSVPWFAEWIGGPSLALIRNCDTPFGKRVVYVRGEPDSWFSIPLTSIFPAACQYKGKQVKGYIFATEHGEYKFRAHGWWYCAQCGVGLRERAKDNQVLGKITDNQVLGKIEVK